MKEEKESIRKRMLERRSKLSPREIAEKSLAVRNTLFAMEQYKNARAVLVYVSTGDEVRTDEIIQDCLRLKKKTAVPSLRRNRSIITPSLIKSMDELSGGVFGIREPVEESIRPVAPSGLDLVIAPGAAFDRSGNRVGLGGGYYDRLLPGIRPGTPVIALAFGFQLEESVPSGAHDARVDFVLTEEGLTVCKS